MPSSGPSRGPTAGPYVRPQHPWPHLYPPTPGDLCPTVPSPASLVAPQHVAPQHVAPVCPRHNQLGVLPGCPVGSLCGFPGTLGARCWLAPGGWVHTRFLASRGGISLRQEMGKIPGRPRSVAVLSMKPFPGGAHRGRRHKCSEASMCHYHRGERSTTARS